MKRTPRGLLCATLVIAGVLGSGSVSAQSLDALSNEVDSVIGRLATVRSDYVRPVTLQREMSLATRLADGQLRYILGEYDAAAIILVDVVENPAYEGLPGYSDARFLLADSLFEARNFILARGYFEDVISDNDPVYGLDAARRLLEIAFEMNRYEGLDTLYAQLQRQRGATMGPEIAYVRAKALYFGARYEDAADSFSGDRCGF